VNYSLYFIGRLWGRRFGSRSVLPQQAGIHTYLFSDSGNIQKLICIKK
jgi:hypothetical protein